MIPSEPAPDLPDLDDDLTPGHPTRFGDLRAGDDLGRCNRTRGPLRGRRRAYCRLARRPGQREWMIGAPTASVTSATTRSCGRDRSALRGGITLIPFGHGHDASLVR